MDIDYILLFVVVITIVMSQIYLSTNVFNVHKKNILKRTTLIEKVLPSYTYNNKNNNLILINNVNNSNK